MSIIISNAQNISPVKFEVSSGASVNTRGGLPSGLDLQILGYKDKYHQLGGRIEFQNVKHQKELKYPLGNTGSFVYGKINHLISIRPQFVYSKNIFLKEKENGVKINYNLLFGPSIGLVKPYYIRYYNEDSQTYSVEPFSTTNTNIKIDSQGILYNLKESKIIYGVNASALLDFELSQNSLIFWGIKLGITTELYPSGIQILPTNSPNKAFTFLFINLYGGIRR